MSKWTQKSITDWATKTFGEPNCLTDIVDRAEDEFKEFRDAAYDAKQGLIHYSKVASEVADVVIVLSQYLERLGYHLQDEIDKKMDINNGRNWVNTGVGVGRHI